MAEAIAASYNPNFSAIHLDTIKGDGAKGVPFYLTDVPPIPEQTRIILQEYSKIPPDDIDEHVKTIRDRAWEVRAYPCIGLFRFLTLGLPSLPAYPEIVSRLKSHDDQRLLDLGCCFGQELRSLVHAGVPSKQLYGSDLRADYWDLGLDLFNDRPTLESTFLAGDVFDFSPTSTLLDLNGKIDFVFAGSFFHLFNWDQQFLVARRVVKLLRPAKGSMIVGRQLGRNIAGPASRRLTGGTSWRHDAESWAALWKLVGRATETEWDCQVFVGEFDEKEKRFLRRIGENMGDVDKYAQATKFAFQMTRV